MLLGLQRKGVHVDGVLVRSVVDVRQSEDHAETRGGASGENRLTELVGSHTARSRSVGLDDRSWGECARRRCRHGCTLNDELLGRRTARRGGSNRKHITRDAARASKNRQRRWRRDLRAHREEGTARVVLVRLNLPEVVAIALVEAILAVDLKAGTVHNVIVAERLREAIVEGQRRSAIRLAGVLEHPHQLLDRVVQRQVNASIGGRERLLETELELVNQVLVRLLGKTATLIHVQVDVVNVERHVLELGQEGGSGRHRCSARGPSSDQVRRRGQSHIDAHLVVLEGDQGQRQSRVAAEPELQRNVEDRRATTAGHRRRLRATEVATKHGVELDGVVKVGGQVLPQEEPLAVVGVDDLTANLHLNLLEELVAETTLKGSRPLHVHSLGVGELDLQVGLVHQIRVAVDDGNDTLSILRRASEVHTKRLHGEVRMTLVEHLPKGDVGISSDVGILSTIRNELKKTTAHLVYSLRGYILLPLTQ